MFSDNMPGFKPPTDQEKINYLNQQIKKKDEEIARLKSELSRCKQFKQEE